MGKLTKNDYVKMITDFVKKYGTKNWYGEYELETFELCTDYEVMLADSTIDKIETEDDGHLRFYYNENTNDYDHESAFAAYELKDFHHDLTTAFYRREQDNEEVEMENLKPIIMDELMPLVSDSFDRDELADNILEDVYNDVKECADEEYNNSDVRLAIVRVLLAKTEKN